MSITSLLQTQLTSAKNDITADIAAGVIPPDIASFQAIDDYKDPNRYIEGISCEDDARIYSACLDILAADVDAWIKSGMTK